MRAGLEARMDRLFNRHADGRAVCVAADHGYMSDVTSNVVEIRPIVEKVIRGAWIGGHQKAEDEKGKQGVEHQEGVGEHAGNHRRQR